MMLISTQRTQRALVRRLRALTFFMTLSSAVLVSLLSACSFMLDPTVCERDSDCGGGVCQLGVCVGPREEVAGAEAGAGVMAGVEAGAGVMAGVESGVMAGVTAGVESGVMAGVEAGAGVMAGVEAGVETPDMGGPEVFSCRFLTERSLSDVRRLSQGKLYSGEAELRVYVEAIAPERWLDEVHLLLNASEQSLTEEEGEEGVYSALVTLPSEGEHRLRLLIGPEGDVRCAAPLDVALDTSAPELSVLNPATREAWLPAQEGAPSAQVELSVRDESLVSVLLNGEQIGADIEALSFTHEVTLEEGEQRLNFVARDLVGNESEPVEVIFYYDATPPLLHLSSPQGPRLTTEERALTLEGIVYARSLNGEGDGVEANARVELTRRFTGASGGEQINRQLTTSNDRGLFSLNLTLDEGVNELELCAYDRALNRSCTQLTATYTPPQPCVELTSAPFSATADYTLTGSLCPSVERVEVRVDGGVVQEATLTGEGASRAFSLPLSFANHAELKQVSVSAVGAEGRRASASMSVMFDETPPSVTLITPLEGACTNQLQGEVCARVDDPESEITGLTLNGVPLDLSAEREGAWWRDFCVIRPLRAGSNTLTLNATNGAGRTSSASRSVTVDTLPPSVSFEQAEGAWYGASSRGVVTVRGVVTSQDCALAPQGFKVYTLGLTPQGVEGRISSGRTPSLSAGGAFTYLESFEEGERAIEVELSDLAGNTRSVIHRFKVDRSAPDIYLQSPETEQVVGRDESLSVSLRLEDAGSGVQRVTANASPLSLSPVPNASPSAWLATGTLTFDEGDHYITLRAEDEVGNLSELTINYQRDVTPPTAQLLSPVAGEGVHELEVVLVSAEDEASGVSTVSVNGAPAEREGALWVAPATLIDSNDLTLSVSVTDVAGNVNDATLTPPLSVPVTLPPYALRPAERSGLPSASLGLTSVAGLWWGAWARDEGPSLLSIASLSASAQSGGTDAEARANVGVSDSGGFKALPREVGSVTSGRFSLTPASLPSAEELRWAQPTWLGELKTLLTLHSEPAFGAAPLIKAWALAGEMTSAEPPADPTVFVEVPLGLAGVSADVLHLTDITGDGLDDLIVLHQEVATFGVRFFTQSSSGDGMNAFQIEVNGLSARGVSDLSAPQRRAGERALGRLWSVDVNHDDRLDLVQEATATEPTKLWLAQADGLSFSRDAGFPSANISGLTLIDWDNEGEQGSPLLDLIAWDNDTLYRYELAQDQSWSVTSLITLPEGLNGALPFDVDGDGSLELLTYGVGGFKAWVSDDLGGALGGASRVYQDLLPSVNDVTHVVATDLDQDGDEDLLFVSGAALWVASANGASATTELNSVTLTLEGVGGLGAVTGARVLIDEDGDFSFERAVSTRSEGSTLLNFSGTGSVNLQVIFPDRGATGGNQVGLPNVPKGAQVTVEDPQ